MLEIETNTGQTVYIAPSHVVSVVPDETLRFVVIALSTGQSFHVTGSAKQAAEKISAAL
jgi:H2-forming N5,N10-methylenetetrahydromethanopterin dehydrogenase-like enzyme